MKPKGAPKLPPTTEERSTITTMSAAGASISKIARHMGRSRHMVRNVLAEPEVRTDIEDEKAALTVLYRSRARDCVAAIDADKIRASSALQLATASGILLDKAQLLSGDPTANINVNILLEVAKAIRDREDAESERLVNQSPARQG